jgi:hypothetical protein
MGYKWDDNAIRWIDKNQPLSRPTRKVSRYTLLRGLAEEVVFEDSASQLYAGLLAAAICANNRMAQNEYEHMLAQVRSERKKIAA